MRIELALFLAGLRIEFPDLFSRFCLKRYDAA
jgi:hypothetical protein